MKSRFVLALAAGLSLLASAVLGLPAHAADNLPAKDNLGVAFKYRALDLGGSVYLPAHAILDAAGVPLLTSGNPGVFTLSGVVPLPTGAATAAAQATGNSSLATLASVSGGLADVAWDGAAASASHVSILKAVVARLAGLLSVDTVVRSASTDRGGTITAGGTAQPLMAANANRRGFLIQNQHASADLYVNCLATASAGPTSLKIPAGALYETGPHHSGTGACSVFGATSGQAFYAREF